ncbi:hypothetical protein [Streptosporangium roseum]|uniref:hypothetical protein n=1 Tax=Streptosporangium roseum TaxID=2001 RepID=UPI00332A2434
MTRLWCRGTPVSDIHWTVGVHQRRLLLDPAVRELLREAAPGLRTMIADTLLDLAEEPEPLAARPYRAEAVSRWRRSLR